MDCLEKNPDRRPSMEQVARVYAESASLVQSNLPLAGKSTYAGA